MSEREAKLERIGAAVREVFPEHRVTTQSEDPALDDACWAAIVQVGERRYHLSGEFRTELADDLMVAEVRQAAERLRQTMTDGPPS